jgi:hypothetical protein
MKKLLLVIFSLMICSAVMFGQPGGENITIPPPEITNALCYGSNGTATVSVPVAGFNYSWWSTTAGVTGDEIGTGTTFSGAAGIYILLAEDGCQWGAKLFTITQPAILALVSAEVTTEILCFGGTATVTIVATGGTAPLYTFNGETNSTGVFAGVLAGEDLAYSITDAEDCGPVTGTIDVTQPAQLAAPLATMLTQPTCALNSGSVTISGLSGTGTINWTGEATGSIAYTGATQVITGLVSGTYTFTYTVGTCTSLVSLPYLVTPVPVFDKALWKAHAGGQWPN